MTIPIERRKVAADLVRQLQDFTNEHEDDLDTTELDRLAMAIDVLTGISTSPERLRDIDLRELTTLDEFWNEGGRGFF